MTYALIQRMRFIQNSDPNVVSGKPEYKSSPPEILSRFKLHETVGIQSQNVYLSHAKRPDYSDRGVKFQS